MAIPKILIIDDDAVIHQAIGGLLECEGYQLYYAWNGAEGIQTALEQRPDVILLDLMMPGMDGFEVCERIRQNEALAEVPVLMVTALDDREEKIRGLASGADDFIQKPIDRLELRARLKTITRLDRFRKLYEERAQIEQAHSALQRAYDLTIQGWASAMDLRDKETRGHCERVKEMTVALCRLINMTEEALVYVGWGALLHDVGKIAIPDRILHKPSPFTKEEWAVMRKHPEYAYDMLFPIEHLRPALDIPYCHHEKWDGSGYPRGLKQEEIPLSARIFAVVDVWDALTSNRPYRPAWPDEKALNFILEEAGKHFDPYAVRLFFSVIEAPYAMWPCFRRETLFRENSWSATNE